MVSPKNTPHDKYLRHEYEINEYTVRSRLTVRDFSPGDAGLYRCVCKNAMNQGPDRVEGTVFLRLHQGKRVSDFGAAGSVSREKTLVI